jgi:hypothetical protein
LFVLFPNGSQRALVVVDSNFEAMQIDAIDAQRERERETDREKQRQRLRQTETGTERRICTQS